MSRHYTQEMLQFVREQYPLMSLRELVPAFNNRFPGLDVTETVMHGITRNHRITSGRTGCFKKGDTPWNTGKTGYMGANATSFQPGNLPHNHKPLYSERVGKNGYIEMSVPERNPYTGFRSRYKQKHLWIWEQAHGPKPRGHAVIFADGDKLNFDLDNLLLVSRTELLTMNLHDYKNQPPEIKPAVLALARVEAKAGIRTRPGRGRDKEVCR